MAVNGVVLFVKDLDGAVTFYGAVLDAEPSVREETWVEFGGSGAALGLHAIPPHIAADIVIAVPPEPREEEPVKLVLATAVEGAELAALVERLGGVVLRRPWGGVDYTDPEGNVFTAG